MNPYNWKRQAFTHDARQRVELGGVRDAPRHARHASECDAALSLIGSEDSVGWSVRASLDIGFGRAQTR